MNKSKKIAASIYGNSSTFNNLVSQRKKTASTSNPKKKGGKRQPNQGQRVNAQQFDDMQAQIQAQ
jgi:hypothetical protein